MKRILKYKLDITDYQKLPLGKNAQILAVQIQNEEICLWAIVEIGCAPHDVIIRMFGTGHEMSKDDLRYIGTIQQWNGKLIWHVFKEIWQEND